LQSSWSIPVELVIGPDLGISYMAHRGGTVVRFQIIYAIFYVTYIFYNINTLCNKFKKLDRATCE